MNRIYSKALRMLGRKGYFTAELRRGLERLFPEKDIEPVIRQLTMNRCLDDEQTLIGFIRWKLEVGYGPFYIREKLQQRGVERTAREIIKTARDAELDIDAAIAVAIKKYHKAKELGGRKFRRSCLNYLRARGFDVSDCLRILDNEVVADESNFFEGC